MGMVRTLVLPLSWQGVCVTSWVWVGGTVQIKTQNVALCVGDARQVTVTIIDDRSSPINLTGCSLYWAAREPGIEDSGLEKSTESGSIVLADQSTSPGQCQFMITSAEMRRLRPGVYPHRMRLEDGTGQGTVVLRGEITVEPGFAEEL